jgi:hypothetical protein
MSAAAIARLKITLDAVKPTVAIKNPEDERHAEFKEWIGGDFDPERVDADALAEDVATLATRWSRKPAAKRARRS